MQNRAPLACVALAALASLSAESLRSEDAVPPVVVTMYTDYV